MALSNYEVLIKNPNRAKYLQLIQQEAANQGIPWQLLDSIIAVESTYKPNAVGPITKYGHAKGLAQFIPTTAREYGLRVDKEVDERLDPLKAIPAAAKFVRKLYRMADGDWGKVGVGYNAGPGNMHKERNRLTKEAQNYRTYMEASSKYNKGGGVFSSRDVPPGMVVGATSSLSDDGMARLYGVAPELQKKAEKPINPMDTPFAQFGLANFAPLNVKAEEANIANPVQPRQPQVHLWTDPFWKV